MRSRREADIYAGIPPALGFQDDLMLEGLARQVVTDLNTFFSKDNLERSGLEHERLRLARELHDGVLQSLTGIDKVGRVIEDDGCGFERSGRYDLKRLNAQGWDPVSI